MSLLLYNYLTMRLSFIFNLFLRGDMPNTTIILHVASVSPYEELPAAEAGILPGHILHRDASGFSRDILGETYQTLYVAVEDTVSGKGVDDVYSIGDMVYARRLRMGDVVLLRLTSGSSVVEGAAIAPVGPSAPGEVKDEVTPDMGFVGIALETATGPLLAKIEAKYL